MNDSSPSRLNLQLETLCRLLARGLKGKQLCEDREIQRRYSLPVESRRLYYQTLSVYVSRLKGISALQLSSML
jgi:hypothetical protein